MASKNKSYPGWSDVKTKLADFYRVGLLGLAQDMYAASKDNQTFLRASLGLSGDVLKPYKTTIERWLYPDVYKNQDYSVAKVKKAIGQAEGLAELMVFYCEQAIGFSNGIGLDDEGYYNALVRMFETGLRIVMALPEAQREPFLGQLEDVRASGQDIGWGVGEDLNYLWLQAGLEIEA